jgi:hypothetical protein
MPRRALSAKQTGRGPAPVSATRHGFRCMRRGISAAACGVCGTLCGISAVAGGAHGKRLQHLARPPLPAPRPSTYLVGYSGLRVCHSCCCFRRSTPHASPWGS